MTNSAMKRIYKVLAFLVYLVPMLVLFIIRRDHYLQPENAIGFFGVIILIFCCFYFSRQIFDKAFKGKTAIMISGILFIFSFLTQFIAAELMYITGVSFVAAVFAEFINQVAYVYEDYEFKTVDGIKKKNLDKAISQKQAWREAYGLIGAGDSE